MTKQLIVAAAAASLLAGTALAQTKAPDRPQASASTKTEMQSGGAMGGIKMSAKAAEPVRYADADASHLMSSKLVGTEVYNNENENVGEIADLVIDDGKTLTGVVVSVGGFLGMGERYVLIEPSSIALNREDGGWKAHVNTNKDSLKAAPEFTYKAAASSKS
jgi:sporulation protein YlmC with PRC-barrel domain